MANLKDKSDAEIENIKQTFKEFLEHKKLPHLSVLELTRVATSLHDNYNGIENILKQILKHQYIQIPHCSSWHKDLLNILESYYIFIINTKICLIIKSLHNQQAFLFVSAFFKISTALR